MTRLMSARMVAAAIVAVAAAPVAAQPFAKPEDAIAYRKAGMTVMARHFGVVAAMASGRLPWDAKAAADNADIALTMSRLPFSAFLPGTDKGNTKAEAKLFAELPAFNASAQKMQEEMGKLAAAAKGGSQDAVRSAVGGVGAACKSCHDTYWKQ